MAWFPIANLVPQYIDPDTAKPHSGAVLKAYDVGTLNATPFATDNTGDTTVNSVALNASGHPEVSGNTIIPHIDRDYKLALYPNQTAADADSGALWTIDDIDIAEGDPEHATDTGGTDAFVSANDTSTPSTGTSITRDFQTTNTTTTPTLDGTTLVDRGGNALWPGAIDGLHRLYSDGTNLRILDLDTSGIDNPEHATDGGTDSYDSDSNTDVPPDGVTITRDFQSANTTTTPTLDGKTITTRDGSALWAGAVSGVHDVQYDSGADTYLVLEPLPIDEDDMSSDSATAVPTQQSVKAYADTNMLNVDGASSSVSLALDTWRTPNANRPVLIYIEVNAQTDGSTNGEVKFEIDEGGGTSADHSARFAFADKDIGANSTVSVLGMFYIPAGGSYQLNNSSDPNTANSISTHREWVL